MLPKCLRSMGRKLLDLTTGLSSVKRYATEATFQTLPYQLHNLEQPPPASVTVKRDEALAMYKNLFTIRRFETTTGELYRTKQVRGFCHLYIGLEGIACAVHAAMRPQDMIVTSYRCHGWAYLVGIPMNALFSELAGHQNGGSRGKGGSMHMYHGKVFSTSAIVASQIPVAAGAALACKYQGTGGVAIGCYGDGGSNQGQVFEAFNMAKLWNLPCIFLCENNQYGMGTSSERSSASIEFYKRGDYVPGIWVDASDVITIREATKYCIDFCVSGKGPIILALAAYRFVGHSLSDPGTSYRTREEVALNRKTKDPVKNFKEQVLTTKLATADELSQIESDVKKEVKAAAKQGVADKEIPVEELTCDIYLENLEPSIRNVDPFRPLTHKNVGPNDDPYSKRKK